MFSISDSRRTEAIAPDLPQPSQVIARDCLQVHDCFPRYAADQPYIEIGYYRHQNNPIGTKIILGEMGV